MSLDLDLIYSQFNFKVDKSHKNKIYEFEKFRLDAVHLMLYEKDEEIPLAPKAVETLLALVERRGEILSKDELMKTIWTDSIVEESNLAQYLHLLRKILGETKDGKPFIETYRRRGYRFNGEVSVADFSAEIKQENTNQNFVPLHTPKDNGAIREATAGKVVALADWRHTTEADKKSPQKVLPAAQIKEFPSEGETQNAEHSPGKIKSRQRGLAVGSILLLFASIGLGYWFFANRPSNAAIESIAVLPFENATGDANFDYLSDGLSESLIDRLSQLPELKVIARSSSFKYRGADVDLRDAANRLGVQAVVIGKITRRGDVLNIRVEMIDTRDNRQMWSEQYNRQASDALTVQEQIAQAASAKLRSKLTGAEEQRLTKSTTQNPEAFQLYLKGVFHQNKSKPAEKLKAVEYFQQAIALDPNYAQPYVALASLYHGLTLHIDVPQENFPQKARENVLKALALDDQLPDARVMYGVVLNREYDFAGAERELKRAVELNPNHAGARLGYGSLLSNLGRHEEALAEGRRGLELDPISIGTNYSYSNSLFYARKYDECIAQSKKIVEMNPEFYPVHYVLAIAYKMKGDYAASVAGQVRINELTGTKQRAEAIQKSFERGGWEGYLRDATSDNPPFNLPPYTVATFNVALGEKDKAFAILDKLYKERSPELRQIKVDPRLDNLRDDPRFQDLLWRVGLPQ